MVDKNLEMLDDKIRNEYDLKEKEYWEKLEQTIIDSKIPFSEMMRNIPAFIRRRDLPRILSHYELFKKIINLPGSIVELGVYLGAGFFTWSKLLETFCPGDRSRKVYGFDNCQGYEKFSSKDSNPMPWINKIIGKMDFKESYIKNMVEIHNDDNLLPGVERCKIIIGKIEDTVPKYVKNLQGTRIALLYFDVNLYQPTLIGLKSLYPFVMNGGIIAFNGYGGPPWEGEASAIEHYFKEMDISPIFKKYPFSTHPSAYMIKGEN